MTATILSAGLREAAQFIQDVPDLFVEAAYFAVGDTSRQAVPLIKRKIRSQVKFPSNYLNQDRLNVRRKATRVTLESVISARDRPTSLARFAPGATIANSRGRPIIVQVKTGGGATTLRRAFLVSLRNGNTGLAIRLPKGTRPDNAYKPVELTRGGGKGEGAWLLYGPSVDQVMKGVVTETTEEIQDSLNRNFFRHITRLVRRG